jgi:hypothetical protein
MTPYELRALADRFLRESMRLTTHGVTVYEDLADKVIDYLSVVDKQRGIPLSLLLRYAATHGGVYSKTIPSRWPWGAPRHRGKVLDVGDGVNCSTFTAAVLRQCASDVYGAEHVRDSYSHSMWMIFDGVIPWSVLAAARDLCGSEDATGVRLCQGWRGLDVSGHAQKGSAGHTWIEVDTDSGVRIIDATPSTPWRGVRVMAPVPTSWRWDEVRSVALDVDVNR